MMFQLLAIAGSLFFIVLVLHTVRQKKLKEAYALLWLATGFVMLFFSVFINSLRYISELIGIVYPPATLLLMLLGGSILIMFQYALILSRNQEKISRLTQEIAILKNELEKLKNQK